VLELLPLPPEEYEALNANIATHGILVPVLLTDDGRVIDGTVTATSCLRPSPDLLLLHLDCWRWANFVACCLTRDRPRGPG
jgi:hypothetical protein